MGNSFWSRGFVTLAVLLLSLLAWESLLIWQRYEPAGGKLGGFHLVGEQVRPQEPGGDLSQGPLISADRFRGARYQVLTPLAPLDRLLGAEPRCRLVASICPKEQEANSPWLPGEGERIRWQTSSR